MEESSIAPPEDSKEKVKSGRNRKRKKQMYKNIVQQMEFYLGDANMSKSAFIKKLIEKDPWIDLKVFLTFNKLVAMLNNLFGHAENTDDLWKALSCISSDIFEIRENPEQERQIKRRNEIPKPRVEGEADSKTIYVEKLPANVTLEMLQHIFSKYGPVIYVSMPKFKHNGIPKGFAFVEFATDEGAKKSIEGFVLAERKIPVDLDPGELQSIKSYQIEKDQEQKASEETSEPPKKKAKVLIKEEDEKEKEKSEEKSEEKGETTEDQQDEENPEETTEGDKKKRKRKRKRKDKTQVPAMPNMDNPDHAMTVLPKAEWKRLRNKYLNLQRKHITHSKMKLHQYYEKQKEEEAKFEEQTKDSEDQPTKKSLEFTPGIIVKFAVNEPIEDEKKVKQRIRAAVMENVSYVDARIGASEYFVRCAHPDQAKTLSNAKILGNSEILAGQVEKDYWGKIMKDREDKISGKIKVSNGPKKQRGKDRIIKKFHEMQQKENAHKYFNEGEEEVE